MPNPFLKDPTYRAAVKAARSDPDHPARHLAELRRHLASFAEARTAPAHWAYGNPYALVLGLGRPYTAAPRPAGMRKGRIKLCFSNALLLAHDDPGLRYVEGYALSFRGIPTEHGWCARADGTVVDPTWYEPELAAYYGVEIPTDLAVRLTLGQKVHGLLVNDWRHGYRILRTGRIGPPDDEEQAS
jgi:hypothetical protein